MQTPEISSCSNSTRSGSTTSFDFPETFDRRQNLPLSSLRTEGALKTRTIAIAVKAHERLRMDPFDYANDNLVEQRNCKMVVISCLSRLKDEMGVDRIIDVEMFGGISKRKLEAAIDEQILTLNYFLKRFKMQLEKKGIQLEIRVTAGPRSADILVQAARAIRPHWVVLDRRFSGAQKSIHAALDCNLVLMKKNLQKGALVFKLADPYLGPAGHDQLEEDPGPLMEGAPRSPSQGWSTPSSHHNGNGTIGTASTMISNQESVRTQNTTKRSTMNRCIACMCFSSEAGSAVVNGDADGPTDKQTVLYGTTAPNSKATYLGKVGNLSTASDPSIVPCRTGSPEAGPTFFKLVGGSGNPKSRSTRLIEQQLEAQMAISPVEEDGHFQLQL